MSSGDRVEPNRNVTIGESIREEEMEEKKENQIKIRIIQLK